MSRHDLAFVKIVYCVRYVGNRLLDAPSRAGVRRGMVKLRRQLTSRHLLRAGSSSGRLCRFNPASSVRGPKHVVKRGKTPVLKASDYVSAYLEAVGIAEDKKGWL